MRINLIKYAAYTGLIKHAASLLYLYKYAGLNFIPGPWRTGGIVNNVWKNNPVIMKEISAPGTNLVNNVKRWFSMNQPGFNSLSPSQKLQNYKDMIATLRQYGKGNGFTNTIGLI